MKRRHECELYEERGKIICDFSQVTNFGSVWLCLDCVGWLVDWLFLCFLWLHIGNGGFVCMDAWVRNKCTNLCENKCVSTNCHGQGSYLRESNKDFAESGYTHLCDK